MVQETASPIVIIERSGALLTLLKRVGDEIAAKFSDSPPMAALRVPRPERLLVHDAVQRIHKRFVYKRNQQGRHLKHPDLEPRLATTVADLHATMRYQGPVAIDLTSIEAADWTEAQAKLLDERKHLYTLLVTNHDPIDLLDRGLISPELRAQIFRTFCWPQSPYRNASMKRDYFLHRVATKNLPASAAIESNHEAILLLHDVFALSERGTTHEDILHYADAYLSHLGNFSAEKHPVEVLAHFVEHVLDEHRGSTPPAEEADVNAA
ncbi:MAG: hypothetical protein U0487_00440 [Patescibacteria group bacterium]